MYLKLDDYLTKSIHLIFNISAGMAICYTQGWFYFLQEQSVMLLDIANWYLLYYFNLWYMVCVWQNSSLFGSY